jgi:hypothetical protein
MTTRRKRSFASLRLAGVERELTLVLENLLMGGRALVLIQDDATSA